MSVNFNILRTLEPIDVETLKSMHTGTLLRRLKALRSMQERFEDSDWTEEDRDAVAAAGLIAFKNTDIWKAEWTVVKELLAKREHIPRGSKELRRAAARAKQNR